jgi:vancomycin resistance protein VanW
VIRALFPLATVLALGAAIALTQPDRKEVCIGRFSTELRGRTRSQAFNARLSLRSLDGAVVPAKAVFSFNATVGTWSRDVGYRKAPVSFNGQLVRSWGGGVCQTSSTLYNAALLAGMEVVERHPHHHAPGYVPPGRDAAVAFNGIDLRFRNPNDFPVRIEAEWEGDRLTIALFGRRAPARKPRIVTELRERVSPGTLSLSGGAYGRVRNTGKAGYEVATYLVTGSSRRLLSEDSYPAMTRIVEYR